MEREMENFQYSLFFPIMTSHNRLQNKELRSIKYPSSATATIRIAQQIEFDDHKNIRNISFVTSAPARNLAAL